MLRRCSCCVLVVAAIAVPAVAQVEMGVRTGAETPTPSPPRAGASLLFDFDAFDAPCFFLETVPFGTRFGGSGVRFSGPSPDEGGAVINECGGFGVSGHSPPNFLAFNLALYATGPETIEFSPFAEMVTINAGGPRGGTATMECFDSGGGSLGSDTITVTDVLAPLSVVAPDIASCVLSFTEDVIVFDDLDFEPVPVELQSFDIE